MDDPDPIERFRTLEERLRGIRSQERELIQERAALLMEIRRRQQMKAFSEQVGLSLSRLYYMIKQGER